MIQSSDGGASVSIQWRQDVDRCRSTRRRSSITSTTTNHFPYRVCGAQQDNSARVRAERGTVPGGIPTQRVVRSGGGESGYIAGAARRAGHHLRRRQQRLASARKDHATDFLRVIDVWPDSPDGHAAARAVPLPVDGAAALLAARSRTCSTRRATCCSRPRTRGSTGRRSAPTSRATIPRRSASRAARSPQDQTTAEYYGDHLHDRGVAA